VALRILYMETQPPCVMCMSRRQKESQIQTSTAIVVRAVRISEREDVMMWRGAFNVRMRPCPKSPRPRLLVYMKPSALQPPRRSPAKACRLGTNTWLVSDHDATRTEMMASTAHRPDCARHVFALPRLLLHDSCVAHDVRLFRSITTDRHTTSRI